MHIHLRPGCVHFQTLMTLEKTQDPEWLSKQGSPTEMALLLINKSAAAPNGHS